MLLQGAWESSIPGLIVLLSFLSSLGPTNPAFAEAPIDQKSATWTPPMPAGHATAIDSTYVTIRCVQEGPWRTTRGCSTRSGAGIGQERYEMGHT